MKDYTHYTVDDFIGDDLFIQWVKFPTYEGGRFWSDFIAENPNKLPEIEEAARFLKSLGEQSPGLSREMLFRMHQQINDRIDAPVAGPVAHQFVSSRSRKSRTYFYAAVVTISLAAFTSWWILNRQHPEEFIQNVKAQQENSTSQLEKHIIPRGKRSRIILEDGTEIWINADSRLEYPQDFLKRPTRDVYLQGEAYFDVASDKSHPFIVHVQGVEIKALGTSFNVKGYNGEPKIEATLVHGKISIDGDSNYDHVTLAANQRAVFLKDKKRLVVEKNVQTDTYTSWRQGVLVFDDQPLSEILPILERTFNVTIHTDEASSLDCRFTAKINNKSLKEVMELFRTSDTISYTIDGNNVYIKGSFCDD